MSENKFIRHLQGKDTAKSVLEIRNQNTPTSFANMPTGTSDGTVVYSDHRGNATAVLKGTDNWKLSGATLVSATTVYGDGRDLTGSFLASGNTLWVNATYTFANPQVFTANTKWVLKLCGHSLDSSIYKEIPFSLVIKIGNSIITKQFNVREEAFEFCKEFVIDFAESETAILHANTGDTMNVQLLCGDASASATIYNGMSVLTALQRRVDGDAVSSNTRSFDELEEDFDDLKADYDQFVIDTGTALDGKVNIDGTSIMTAPLKFMAGSMRGAVGPYLNGLGFWKLDSQGNLTQIATISDSRFIPTTTNSIDIGRSANTWKDLYLGGKAYVATLNNGADLTVPNKTGTLATMGDVELAARSGRMLTDQGVWYAKMYSATVPPAAENGTNYADFSQVDVDHNPIIVIYERQSGAWVQVETITPPAEYDGYVPITSKIWDIAEQSGQQGGRILWNHQSKEFTPYPQIVSFEDIEITGNSTVVMPQTPSTNQIVNKYYVDYAISNAIGNGTITITQGGTTKGTFTTNQGGNTTIDIDAGGGGSGLNVGDIFYTMRNDNELNGAVECDGATYNTTDFTGAESIGALLEAGKIDYISLTAYADAITQKGWCDKIGWNGTGNTQFRVPTLNAYIVQTNNIPVVGNGMTLGLTDGTNNWGSNINNNTGSPYLITATSQYGKSVGDTSTPTGFPTAYRVAGVTTDPTKSGIIADTTDTAQLRVMIQLATSATDQALETCTGVLADVAALKYDYVVDFQAPTAQNNYTWYRKYKSGWVEQGGSLEYSSGSDTSVVFPVTMANTRYTAFAQPWNSGGYPIVIKNKTTTGFNVTGNVGKDGWQVSGMSAS